MTGAAAGPRVRSSARRSPSARTPMLLLEGLLLVLRRAAAGLMSASAVGLPAACLCLSALLPAAVVTAAARSSDTSTHSRRSLLNH